MVSRSASDATSGFSEGMRMKHKLKSQRGASITFALLLFLVCAVIGSIVLGAGVAAAGRIAKLAESDQRFYSVSSAARLFEEEFSEQTVSVQREKTYTHAERIEIIDNSGVFSYGSEREPVDTDPTYKIKIDSTEFSRDAIPGSITDVFQYYAYLYLFGTESSAENLWGVTKDEFGKNIPTSDISKEIKIQVVGKTELAVKVKMTLNTDGSIQLDFSNEYKGNPANDLNVFTIRVIMKADVMNPTSKIEASDKQQYFEKDTATGETIQTVQSTITETKTSDITWRIYKLEVI